MKKLLLIDDDANFVSILAEFLRLEAFEVIEADGGLVGLKLAKERLPDAIVCDIDMPQMNGYQVLRQLRANSATKNIPFIFLTARSDPHSQLFAFDLGADNFLVKPITIPQLLRAIAFQLGDLAPVISH
jgi:two-component system, sensor histidine kinase and response regulator